jgi:nitrogen fixation NifU-like protein
MALEGIYLEKILEHYRDPHHFGPLDPYDGAAEGDNPHCGDRVKVYVRLTGEGDRTILAAVSFEGVGCAISRASASMMTDLLEGRSLFEAEGLKARFLALMDPQGPGATDGDEDALGDLVALAGVRQYPARVPCATLAWDALQRAVQAARNVEGG